MANQPTENQRPGRKAGALAALVARWALLSQFLGQMFGFVIIGFALDYWAGTGPWGVIIVSVLGIAGSLWLLVLRVLNRK